jgi:hypothetical protein
MVERYLEAFGPSTVADIQSWSGLTNVRLVVERLRPRLRTFRDENGKELLDVPRGLLPDAGTDAPPRFLPDYDNALLAHQDRTRILAREHGQLIGRPTVLVDGFAVGFWKVTREGGRATLNVETLTNVSKKDVAALSDEGGRLLDLVASDAKTKDVRFIKAQP